MPGNAWTCDRCGKPATLRTCGTTLCGSCLGPAAAGAGDRTDTRETADDARDRWVTQRFGGKRQARSRFNSRDVEDAWDDGRAFATREAANSDKEKANKYRGYLTNVANVIGVDVRPEDVEYNVEEVIKLLKGAKAQVLEQCDKRERIIERMTAEKTERDERLHTARCAIRRIAYALYCRGEYRIANGLRGIVESIKQ